MAEGEFDAGEAESDVEAESLRVAGAVGVDDIVAAAFKDVEGVGIGFAAMVIEILGDLLGDVGNGESRFGDRVDDFRACPGVVISVGDGWSHGESPGVGDVFDPERAVGPAAGKVGKTRSANHCVEVADVAVAITEDVDGAEVWGASLR